MFQSHQTKDNSDKKNDNSEKKAPGVDYAQMMQLQIEQSRSDLATQMKENTPAQFMVEEPSFAKASEDERPSFADRVPPSALAVAQASEGREEELQAKLSNNVPAQLKEDAANSVASASSGTTTSLPKDVNAKMENSFGTSFAGVNIHKNSEKATQLSALAYTQGNDVHFAPGQYNPSSTKGQELIGHELTHVVQQRAGRVKGTQNKGGMNVNTDKSLEHEADVMGAKAAAGQRVDIAGKGYGVQRKEDASKNIEPMDPFSKEKQQFKVKNASDYPILIRPEGDGKPPVLLKPDGSFNESVDGFTVPGIKDKVFKLSGLLTWYPLTITNDGINYDLLEGEFPRHQFINWIGGGGLKDEAYFRKVIKKKSQLKNLGGWKPLFDFARNNY